MSGKMSGMDKDGPKPNFDVGALGALLGDYEQRSAAAQGKAAHAYERLLHLAETRDSGQIAKVAQFLAATFNGTHFHFDLFDLRTLDVEVSDDMLCALDALRWGKADLCQLVPDGQKRIEAVISQWGLRPDSGELS